MRKQFFFVMGSFRLADLFLSLLLFEIYLFFCLFFMEIFQTMHDCSLCSDLCICTGFSDRGQFSRLLQCLKEGNLGLYVQRNHYGLLGTGNLGGREFYV